MVNLEWYRTFKSVYKIGNFSQAAKELFISQPAVSQQIAMLEAHVGYKLFNRKSKGVEPTEYAKLLNNLIIEALDRLESVENGFREKAFSSNRLVSVGISKHLFASIGTKLISKFDFIDFTYAENEELFSLVNDKKIDFAIVTQKFDTFDTIQKELGKIKQIVVASNDLDLKEVKKEIKNENYTTIENWLNQQKWYNFDARIPHVKLFWLHVFDKKRPSMVSNYIIPSESEMLATLAENSGVSIVWNINAKHYLKANKLQLLWDSPKMPKTEIYLLARKNDTLNTVLNEVKEEISAFILE
ncbi:LysR family transcriptional regulator [uncultured Flavobacterium sp.]|uniref:LysR family transcriptional regulator n=1 Tax=uncultured Flavobacterium sp. TaxID=165435 RepID=UPI0030EBDCD3|tara:strand:- start:16591 stop:17490 length:900 start_codon:yes stop_codon:yes gene_type:complete